MCYFVVRNPNLNPNLGDKRKLNSLLKNSTSYHLWKHLLPQETNHVVILSIAQKQRTEAKEIQLKSKRCDGIKLCNPETI